jgi:hypothetical protein
MNNKKEKAPPVEKVGAITNTNKREDNTAGSKEQLEKLLEKFAVIQVPDLWHYGAGLKMEGPSTFPHNPQFGEEVLEFWRLAHALQRALRAAKEVQP